jgi:hypothetical protein
MESFLQAIEDSAFPVWVRESPSIFAYTTVLTLHAIGLSTVVGLNWVIALRLLGFAKTIPLPMLRKLVKPMYAGFWINAVSGVILMAASATTMFDADHKYFRYKLLFILFAVINLEIMRRKVFTNPMMDRGMVPPGAVRSAWLAIVFWLAAILCGRITAYPGILGNLFGLS